MGFTSYSATVGNAPTPLAVTSGGTGATSLLGALIFQSVAATAAAGFALQNATPTVFTFTSPNDGNNHRYQLFTDWHVTSGPETGGNCTLTYHTPDGSTGVSTFKPGGQGTGTFVPNGPQVVVVGPNSVVTVAQSVALSVGATTLFAELWGA